MHLRVVKPEESFEIFYALLISAMLTSEEGFLRDILNVKSTDKRLKINWQILQQYDGICMINRKSIYI